MLLKKIKENGVVAVIRGGKPESILSIAEALSNGGVKTLEITVETPRALKIIEQISSRFGNEVIVGAGTVLDAETARAAILAGAQFIFSPTVDVETIRLTKRYGIISIPGALTPTEILKGYESGGDIIKVFPASAFGPQYIKDIHGPLPHIPLMPTGGMNINNVGEYIKAGAVAAGVGSTLVDANMEITKDNLMNLTEKAALFIKEVQNARK